MAEASPEQVPHGAAGGGEPARGEARERILSLFHRNIKGGGDGDPSSLERTWSEGAEIEAKYRHKAWKAGKVTGYDSFAHHYEVTFDNGAVEGKSRTLRAARDCGSHETVTHDP
jgi:hypothetical protein